MPYHLELGSEGRSFHGKAIVVNSQTGEHKSNEPIDMEKAKAQMRVLEGVASEESAPKKRRILLKKKPKAEEAPKAEALFKAIYSLVEKRIDRELEGEKVSKSDLSSEKIRYLKQHIIGDNDAITKATQDLTTKHNIVPGSEIDEYAEAYWRKKVNEMMEKTPAPKAPEKRRILLSKKPKAPEVPKANITENSTRKEIAEAIRKLVGPQVSGLTIGNKKDLYETYITYTKAKYLKH